MIILAASDSLNIYELFLHSFTQLALSVNWILTAIFAFTVLQTKVRVDFYLVADSKVVEKTIENDGAGIPTSYPADAQVRCWNNTKPNPKAK